MQTAPAEEVWVAIDLETTGLDPASDAIIEVGAVKFRGENTLDTFQTLVNPRRRLPRQITALTGIQQRDVAAAPPFDRVRDALADFIGDAPLIAQNATFDLGFLRENGMPLPNPVVDTYDLAYVMRPDLTSYSLERMTERLGVAHNDAHRALADATAAKNIFLTLLEDAYELDVYAVAQMQTLARRSGWGLGYLLDGLAANPQYLRGDADDVGAGGIDARRIAARLRGGGALRETETAAPIDLSLVEALLSEGGALSDALDGFEAREEQLKMAAAVARTINGGGRVIVEAGTGVGKSLAYLLPAALYALKNGKRVVISTNTINLQDQLLRKDMPILVKALSGVDGGGELRFTDLKGRDNYICMRRWNLMRSGEEPSAAEARMLAKTLVWMRDTATGDRAEINLGGRAAAAPWERLSAQGARGCMGGESLCFLRAARDRAAASHLVIVNHALLMADVAAGGTLIGDYDTLIIDEAHHIEESATNSLGFDLQQSTFDDHMQQLSGEGGLPNQAVVALRSAATDESRRGAVAEIRADIDAAVPRMRQSAAALFAALSAVAEENAPRNPRYETKRRVAAATRAQPNWSDSEIAWENADLTLAELGRLLGRLGRATDGLEDAGIPNYEALQMEIANTIDANKELREKLKQFVVNPDDNGIYWLASRSGRLSLHMAPLHVAELLNDKLFSQKRAVAMTSATLSANGSFAHIIERAGFADADELLLGSPFDYAKNAALCVPKDMPDLRSWAYQDALEQAIADAAIAADGRVLALFTSYGSLAQTADAISDRLRARGIETLSQRPGEPAAQLVQRFIANPKAALLGTMSLWEGIDLAGDLLQTLIVARLPFTVPTDPIFEARSELYDNGFMQYGVPQAILRLRQGFGRLIRTKTDRGVAIILDKRVVATRYGAAFLRSLPPARRDDCSLYELQDMIRAHLNGNPSSHRSAAQSAAPTPHQPPPLQPQRQPPRQSQRQPTRPAPRRPANPAQRRQPPRPPATRRRPDRPPLDVDIDLPF